MLIYKILKDKKYPWIKNISKRWSMKVKSGMEQAICILIMLATQKDQLPIKSYTFSARLGVSDSYL